MSRKSFIAMVLMSGLIVTGTAGGEEKTAPSSAASIPGATEAMSSAMNPATYANMMGLMMNPTPVLDDPLTACKQCHTDEDTARYGKTMGPMLSMMTPNYWANPNAYMNMMNPNTYMGMMAPVMDPDTYRKWYDAWMKKYGEAAGAASGANK